MLALALLLATPTIPIPEGAALRQAVLAADARFFRLFFEECDPAEAATALTADFEMYHDKAGVVATAAAPFVDDYLKACTARAAPDAWRSRRELLPETLRIDPVPGFGAIEEGEHVFYERRGDGPEKKVGQARFVQLWKLEDGRWKLARVFSYAHRAIE